MRIPWTLLIGVSACALTLILTCLSPTAWATNPADDAIALVGYDDAGTALPMIVDATDVSIEVTASYAAVTVTQRFANPYDVPMEAIYRYPLPHDAAVTRVAMIIGDRLITSELQPKEEARKTYESAKAEGHRAALTESLKPNVFEQAVANMMPGDVVHISLHFVAPIDYREGVYRFDMPTVVGPRYSPEGELMAQQPQTDEGGALNPGYTEGNQARHALSLSMHLKPGKPIFQVVSDTHTLDVSHTAPDEAWVRLDDPEALANQAVNIQYRLASAEASAGVLTHRASPNRPGTFALTIDPPVASGDLEVVARELIFVVDTSGSMMGSPIERVRAVMKHAVTSLGPNDIFNIIDFSSSAAKMSERPLSNTPQNVERALAFITELRSAGGTDMLAGIRAALDATPDPARMRVVCFMTDGYIGNDEEVLREIRHRIGQSRLFSFGVGADINDFLLTQMSKVGRGATQTVHIGEFAEPVDQVVGRFYAMIGQPVMTDIEIDWGNLQVEGLGDAPIPDLFMGQPLRLIGRYSKPGHGSVRVRGRRGEEKIDIVIPLSLPRLEREHAAIEVMWAKEQIHQRLSQHDWEDTPEVIEAVTEIAMRYNLLSRYTSFVAVERTIVANEDPDRLARVLAAAHLPAGMGDNGLVGAPRPVTLSPNAIKPGDPEILVDAPEQARAVTALLPWGEAVYCTWDAGLQKWLGRFLVPREAQDGHYRVRIFVETALGDITIHSVGYTVDSEAPMMRLELDATSIRAGGVLGVRAYPIEAHADPGEGIAHFRAELRRAVVHLGPQRVVLSPAKDGTHWEGELRLDQTFAAGQHSVRLVVTDRANNTSSSETVLEVK